MKRLLNELSLDELKKLYEKNHFLQTQVEEYRDDTADFWVREYLDGLPRRVDYSISGYSYSYINVREDDYREFIEYCNEIDRDFELFYTHRDLLDRLTARSDVFEDILNGYKDISDSKWELFLNWMSDGVRVLTDYLVGFLQCQYETDPIELLDCCVDNIGDEYETDGEYIYEVNVRKYA